MTTMTVAEMYDAISERHSRCSDYKVSSGSLQWRIPDALDFPMTGSMFSQSASLNDRAFKQVADRFEVPANWLMDIDKCPNPLRQLVMNWKFAHVEEKSMLLRAITIPSADDEVLRLRAVLSSRYQPYDHKDLWEAVMAAVAQLPAEPKVVLRGPVDDDIRGYLLFDSIQFDAQRDRPDTPRTQDGGGTGGLHPAVYFGNSEVGGGRVRICAGLYRSFCSNGSIYGWKEEGALAITHLWSQKNHIALAVNEGIANALNLSEDAAQKMVAAMDVRIEPTNLGGIFDKWSDKYGLTVASKDAWKAMVRGDATLFDVVNAATVIAHDIKSAEEVEQVERMAGDLLAELSGPRR